MSDHDPWTDTIDGFRVQVREMFPSQLVLLVATRAGLPEIANDGYDAGDPATWLSSETLHERVGELLAVAMGELDVRFEKFQTAGVVR